MNKPLRYLFFLAGIFIFGLLSGHITIKILSSGDMVSVPDLKGKSIKEAEEILQKIGLHLRQAGKDYDPNIPKGHIISQDVLSDNMIKRGSEIPVIVSMGHPIENVLDVVGLPVDFAEAMLKERGIVVKRILYVHSERVEKGIILAQRPEPTEKKGEGISILVSVGNYEK